jgi:hypothetical protein
MTTILEPRFIAGAWDRVSEWAGTVARRVNAKWVTDDVADAAITPAKLAQVPAIGIYRDTSQVVGSGALAVIQMNQVEYVTGGAEAPEANLDVTLARHHAIIRRDGIYRISGHIGMTPSGVIAANSVVVVSIRKNAAELASNCVPAFSGTQLDLIVTKAVPCEAGDLIDLACFHNTTLNQTVFSTAQHTRPSLNLEYVGDY